MMHIQANSATQAFEKVLHGLKTAGASAPRGLKIKEAIACTIEITNPRNRIIQTPERKFNTAYAIGELLWYLSGRNDLETMAYYSSRMRNFSDDGLTLNSAYGYRIFGHHPLIGFDQWENVKRILKTDPDSRQAIIHLHTPNDKKTKDEVCTLSLQFFIRDGKLDMATTMRSNDIVYGFTYDVFAFTMLQEFMSNELCVELGTYYHNVGSMHIYEKDFWYLDEITHVKPFAMDKIRLMSHMFYYTLKHTEEMLRNMDEVETWDYVQNYASGDYDLTGGIPADSKFFHSSLALWALSKLPCGERAKTIIQDQIIDSMRLVHEGYADILANCFACSGDGSIKLIVDGIDGSGKTTLISALFDKLGYPVNVQHYSRPTKNFRFFDDYAMSLSKGGNTIYDRHFLSELVYSASMNRPGKLDPWEVHQLISMADDKGFAFVIFVFDDDELDKVIARMDKKDREDFELIAKMQNLHYESIAKFLVSLGIPVLLIKQAQYDIDEQIGFVKELIERR